MMRRKFSDEHRLPALSKARWSVSVALLILLSGALPAAAQSLHGIVSSAATTAPIEGALVTLVADGEAAHSVLTDRNGFYQIGGIRAGEYSLEIRHLAYSPHTEPITFTAGETRNLDPRLEPAAVELEGDAAVRQAALVLRYEDLCENPSMVFARILKHCELPPEDLPKLAAHLNAVSSLRVGRLWSLMIKVVTPAILVLIFITGTWSYIVDGYGGYPTWFLLVAGWAMLAVVAAASLLLSFSRYRRPFAEDYDPETQFDLNDTSYHHAKGD